MIGDPVQTRLETALDSQIRSRGHVLVVGIDGVRLDTLRTVATPHLDALATHGFLVPVRVNDAGPTISGPGWSTILTGVLTTDHGVVGNDFAPGRFAEHPDVLAVASAATPPVATWAAAAWLPLVTLDSGGPLLRNGGWFPPGPQVHAGEDWEAADQAVTDRTVRFLTTHDASAGSAVFCYLGGPDEVAHQSGTGREYRDMITASDRRLGQLLAAIAARGEDWTAIVVTDHGHIDEGGHGGESDSERTAWIAAAGSGIQGAPVSALEQADVAAHALHVLGLPPTSAAFFGRPFGAR